ncbi:MAG TPA: glycine cleavage system protein GcvH [Thermomicrobiales bacterium]|nr:glycine cleavage system protein GcvH [Thermomicrobiales bacterium]
MAAPENRKYTKTHEWVQIDGDIATLGLTDHAQQELGDVTYLELPEAGDSLSAGEPFGVVESVKAASDVYSPVDGEVVERNDSAIDAPEVINQSPYDGAWLVKVKISDPSQLEALMDSAAYDEFESEA